jgi:NAD(P)H dehydrogenase (quinone)
VWPAFSGRGNVSRQGGVSANMLIQVVHCHPLVESYDHALFRAIVQTLEQNGHEIIATDLYREQFDPTMTIEERRTYMGNGYDTSAVAKYVDILKKVEGLILCFPHWWFSMPAMLKGWVDRVWGPRVAFTYDPKDGHLAPILGNIRLFGVVTTYGSPWWIVRIFAGDAGRMVLMRGMKPLCARRARSFYLAHYGMDSSTAQSRGAFLDKVRRRIAAIA